MTLVIGDFDLEAKIGHNVQTKRVGQRYLYITGYAARGEGGGIGIVESMTDYYKYSGRYNLFEPEESPSDFVQDYSPDGSALKFVQLDEGSSWYGIDSFDFLPSTGRPDLFRFTMRLTRLRLSGAFPLVFPIVFS